MVVNGLNRNNEEILGKFVRKNSKELPRHNAFGILQCFFLIGPCISSYLPLSPHLSLNIVLIPFFFNYIYIYIYIYLAHWKFVRNNSKELPRHNAYGILQCFFLIGSCICSYLPLSSYLSLNIVLIPFYIYIYISPNPWSLL